MWKKFKHIAQIARCVRDYPFLVLNDRLQGLIPVGEGMAFSAANEKGVVFADPCQRLVIKAVAWR